MLADLLPRAGTAHSLTVVLETLVHFTSAVREWQATDAALVDFVDKHARALQWRGRRATADGDDPLGYLLKDLINNVPEDWRPSDWPADLPEPSSDDRPLTRPHAERALARYLGTRLCASWVAYQGEGLLSVTGSLIACHALVVLALTSSPDAPMTFGRMTNALRAADWLVLHLLDRDRWAASCSESESFSGATRLHALVAAAGARLDRIRWASRLDDTGAG